MVSRKKISERYFVNSAHKAGGASGGEARGRPGGKLGVYTWCNPPRKGCKNPKARREDDHVQGKADSK